MLRISVDPRARDAGATSRYRSAGWRAPGSWNHGFAGDFISSRVLRRHRSFLSAPSLFFGGIRFARAHSRGEALLASRHFCQLRAISAWRAPRLFLVAAKDNSLFLPRHPVAWLDAYLDRAAVLFFCDAVHDRFRSRFRIAGSGFGSRALRLGHLQIHGAHATVRDRAHFYPGDDHYADAGYPDVDRDGTPDVSAL